GERNAWTLSLLDLRPEDHVLDVGCGPGALIQALAVQVTSGIAAGVDLSPVMLRQAARHNAKTIHAGRVQLQQGSASAKQRSIEPSILGDMLEERHPDLCRMFSPQIADHRQQGAHGLLKDLLDKVVFILIIAIERRPAHHRA
ncbi:MAG TPA: methyltransferase domain-containing protein, partial [Roseiflexaceae bacterium]|nr:methyltransferase domain-containing protein [Roseiflexaceae bacterium]